MWLALVGIVAFDVVVWLLFVVVCCDCIVNNCVWFGADGGWLGGVGCFVAFVCVRCVAGVVVLWDWWLSGLL